MTTEETIEALAQFESWREDTLLAGPDVSLTAYIKVLEAAEPDPRIAEVRAVALAIMEDLENMTDEGLRGSLRAIVRITEPAIEHADVEEFTF